MNRRCWTEWLLLAVVFALSCPVWCAQQNTGAATSNQGQTTVPGQSHNVRLVSAVPNGEWTLPAGDYANTRYSPLSEINTANVKNLKAVSVMQDGIPHGHEGQPLVVNNTMYMVTPFPNNLIAFDLKKPGFPVKWKYQPHPDPQAQGRSLLRPCEPRSQLRRRQDFLCCPGQYRRRRGCQHRPRGLAHAGRRYPSRRNHNHGAAGCKECRHYRGLRR